MATSLSSRFDGSDLGSEIAYIYLKHNFKGFPESVISLLKQQGVKWAQVIENKGQHKALTGLVPVEALVEIGPRGPGRLVLLGQGLDRLPMVQSGSGSNSGTVPGATTPGQKGTANAAFFGYAWWWSVGSLCSVSVDRYSNCVLGPGVPAR